MRNVGMRGEVRSSMKGARILVLLDVLYGKHVWNLGME